MRGECLFLCARLADAMWEVGLQKFENSASAGASGCTVSLP